MTTQKNEQFILVESCAIIPLKVMKDRELSSEAKGIYAFLASCATTEDRAATSVERICHELNISEGQFREHKRTLVDKGYLSIENVNANGQSSNDLYVIKQTIPTY